MGLIAIKDFEIVKGKKLNKESKNLQEALKIMKVINKFHEEEFEDVIDPLELLLTLHKLANIADAKRGNTNGKTK